VTRIKLALVIPTLDRSGAEKQFTLLATGLSQADFDVRVALLTRGGPFEQQLRDAGIAVEHIQKRWKADPWALKRLANWIRAEQPDVIHSWLFAAHAYVRLAVRSAQRPRIMISERCVDSWKGGWQHALDRWLLPRTDLVVGNSAAVADYYHQRGVPREKLRVVYNGFDVAELPPTLSGGERNRRRAELLAELGFPPDAWVAGCI
jgi:glycosyltransferase involved in cell wall biosynthesis